MKTITGGVCAAKGYKASGIHCGIRKNRDKRDLSLIYSEVPAACAGVVTRQDSFTIRWDAGASALSLEKNTPCRSSCRRKRANFETP